MAKVGEELASSLDYETTLTNVARLAVPWFADWCAVDIVQDDGTLRRLAVQHVDPDKIKFGYEFGLKYPPSEDHLSRLVMKTGEAVMLPQIPDELLVRRVRSPEHLALIRTLGLKSVICAPLAVHGRTSGVLTFVTSETDRRYAPGDLQYAKEIARRAAVAVAFLKMPVCSRTFAKAKSGSGACTTRTWSQLPSGIRPATSRRRTRHFWS